MQPPILDSTTDHDLEVVRAAIAPFAEEEPVPTAPATDADGDPVALHDLFASWGRAWDQHDFVVERLERDGDEIVAAIGRRADHELAGPAHLALRFELHDGAIARVVVEPAR